MTYGRTNGRTDAGMDGRTNGRESLGLQRLRRETKNQTIPMNQSKEKWEKPHFYAFLRRFGGLEWIKIIPNNLKRANV